jgi:tRNA threonylcarbamoyladenosine biosynthesis protein TsaB
MKILAFDLSSRRGSIARCDGDETLEACEWSNDRRTSAPFFTALEEMIRRYRAPEMIVVGLGPGSYTGARIAISAAMGIQRTTGACLFGLASVSAISAEDEYAVIGDAKRTSFFFVRVQRGELVHGIELLSEKQMSARLSEINYSVYTSDDLPQFNNAELRFPSAESLASAAQRFPQNLARVPLTPIYLREPHITSPQAARK